MEKLDRYSANLQILQLLSKLVEAYPDWRFQQILQNVDISTRDGKDLFYEESVDTLNTMKKNPIIRASANLTKFNGRMSCTVH